MASSIFEKEAKTTRTRVIIGRSVLSCGPQLQDYEMEPQYLKEVLFVRKMSFEELIENCTIVPSLRIFACIVQEKFCHGLTTSFLHSAAILKIGLK